MLVLDRSDNKWLQRLSTRYFVYPVHISCSFLLTKGLHAAMYLILLRLLHRDYNEAYRLTDSIATDTSLSSEGKQIFKVSLDVLKGCCYYYFRCALKAVIA